MLNSIWLREPYKFAPSYAQEVNSYLNASARVFITAQQVCATVSLRSDCVADSTGDSLPQSRQLARR